MNCQFEFTATQCPVAYGEEAENKTKQNKQTNKQTKLPFCDAL